MKPRTSFDKPLQIARPVRDLEKGVPDLFGGISEDSGGETPESTTPREIKRDTTGPKVYSVSAINKMVRSLIEGSLRGIWIEGEVSNHRRQTSGHHYFTVRDEFSQLDCVLFRGNVNTAGETKLVSDGLHIRLFGDLTVYEVRGRYQLMVKLVQPCGVGSLQAKFEALKAQLNKEGLFDPARKRTLPRFPRAIAIVTSPTGAAIQDMLQILSRRAPWLPTLICPVRVQGKGAADEIAEMVRFVNRESQRCRQLEASGQALTPYQTRLACIDVVVVTRGGGSLEDLWEFNEEAVARAIHASQLPVLSAVGHEIDFTICDFVADFRAPTPSAAAEIIVPETVELMRQVQTLSTLLQRRLRGWVTQSLSVLRDLANRGALRTGPQRKLQECGQQLDYLEQRLQRHSTRLLQQSRERLQQIYLGLKRWDPSRQVLLQREQVKAIDERLSVNTKAQLQQSSFQLQQTASLLRVLGPQATLERGYSITSLANSGEILFNVASATPGTEIMTSLSKGKIRSRVIPDPEKPAA